MHADAGHVIENAIACKFSDEVRFCSQPRFNEAAKLQNFHSVIDFRCLRLNSVSLSYSQILFHCYYRDWFGFVRHLCYFELLLQARHHA